MTVASLRWSEDQTWPAERWSVRTSRVLLVALALFTLGNLGRIPLLDLGQRQAPLLINDLCVLAVIAVGAFSIGNARSLRLNDVSLAAILFASIGALAAVAAIP